MPAIHSEPNVLNVLSTTAGNENTLATSFQESSVQVEAVGSPRRLYRVRLRCLSCMGESYRSVLVDPARAATPKCVDGVIRSASHRESFECETCTGQRSRIVAYFAEGA